VLVRVSVPLVCRMGRGGVGSNARAGWGTRGEIRRAGRAMPLRKILVRFWRLLQARPGWNDDDSRDAADTRAVLVSLYRKFVWADFLRREYERYRDRDAEFMRVGLEERKIGSFEEAFEADMYMCLWFSVLYVVIEGWPTLRLKFDKLTPLLRSNNKNLLKDFRDATFHPLIGVMNALMH